jgi:hypothetical protein
MIEVFKTNIQNKKQAQQILHSLESVLAGARINVDLQDCDKILRVEGIHETLVQSIISRVHAMGIDCEILN